MKSIQFRGYISNGTSALFNKICVILIYDSRPRGVNIAIGDIFSGSTASDVSLLMNNDVNSGRFKIVRRWDYVLASNSTAGATNLGVSIIPFDHFVQFTNSQNVVYTLAATGGIADIEEGALYLCTFGNTANGVNAAVLRVSSRIRFVDT